MGEQRAVLPCEVSLKAKFIDEDTVDFEYQESFEEKYTRAGDRTFEALSMLAGQIGIGIERVSPTTIKVTGKIPYRRLGSMMVTEFMCWSDIGEITLRELMILPMAGAIEMTRDTMIEKQGQVLKEIADGLGQIRGVRDPGEHEVP